MRLIPAITLAAMLGPVAMGLLGTVLTAFDVLPALGHHVPSLDPFRALLAWGGLADAMRLSLTTGLGATAISLLIVTLFAAGWSGTRAFARMEQVLSPLLAVPHAAAAFGLAILVAPSGWLLRLVSPWPSGIERPPDILVTGDPLGLAMLGGLVAKEVPFLLLMLLAARGQAQSQRSATVAAALGYGRMTGWLKTVFPRVYAQIRLPVYVVLAYAMSVVDVALILGPTTPPTLAVQITRWMSAPDLGTRFVAAAGSVLQLGLTVAALCAWRLAEMLIARIGRRWIAGGTRGGAEAPLRAVGLLAAAICAGAVLLGLAGLLLWSVAGRWSFPDALPDGLTLRTWTREAANLADAARDTAIVAAIATGAALALTIGCLEVEARRRRRLSQAGLALLYMPLIVPQISFLPGLQFLALSLGADIGLAPVAAAHLIFVLPYVYLSLSGPWHAWDPRYGTAAAALGTSTGDVLVRIRLPMLLRPVMTAAAVGFAVSVGQYLPTLLLGGGRVATLTTEAVALGSGGDRRAIGAYGAAQAAAAWLPFALATLLPYALHRNRRGLHG